MKTAMQELIDWLEDPTITQNQDKDNCIIKAKSLLEKEKQQIIDAVTYGNRMEFYDGTEMAGEQYYNETFGEL